MAVVLACRLISYFCLCLSKVVENHIDVYCIQGIACDLESDGFKHLHKSTEEVLGESKPYSDCGSLPLVGDLQKAGFDVQVGP